MMDTRIFKGTVGVVKSDAKATLLDTMLNSVEDATQIGASTLAVKVGESENGKPVYVKVTLTALEYEDRIATKKEFKAFDLDQAVNDFNTKRAEKLERESKSKADRLKDKISKLQKQLANTEQ